MSQIRIKAITESKTGKSWRVQVGNNWYGASKDLLTEADVGKLYEASISTGDFGPWIDNAVELKQTSAASNMPLQTPQNAPRGPETVTGTPYWLPMASNVVAHAIAAGLIKEPIDIKKWVFGAMNAAKGAAEGDLGV